MFSQDIFEVHQRCANGNYLFEVGIGLMLAPTGPVESYYDLDYRFEQLSDGSVLGTTMDNKRSLKASDLNQDNYIDYAIFSIKYVDKSEFHVAMIETLTSLNCIQPFLVQTEVDNTDTLWYTTRTNYTYLFSNYMYLLISVQEDTRSNKCNLIFKLENL